MELLSNAAHIGSVLFHTRQATGHHLFELREDIRFVPKQSIPVDYYCTVNNPSPRFGENESTVYLYALLDIDMSEKDSSSLNPQNKPYNRLQPACRYDAQYSTLDDLSV